MYLTSKSNKQKNLEKIGFLLASWRSRTKLAEAGSGSIGLTSARIRKSGSVTECHGSTTLIWSFEALILNSLRPQCMLHAARTQHWSSDIAFLNNSRGTHDEVVTWHYLFEQSPILMIIICSCRLEGLSLCGGTRIWRGSPEAESSGGILMTTSPHPLVGGGKLSFTHTPRPFF